MKKLFLLVLAIFLFVACQEKPQQRYFENSVEIETVKAGIKAYEDQDWTTWKANFADTAKIFHNTNKGASPDQMIEGMKGMLSNFSSYGFGKEGNIYEMVVDKEGKTWVNYWGNWGGKAKVTEKKLAIPVHLTVEFANGKIVQEFAYYDTAGISETISEIESVNSMPDEQKEIYATIKKMIPIWNKNDQQALKTISAPNLIRNTNGTREVNNQDEYAAMMSTFFTGFPDFKVILEDTNINNNKAIITWRCTGTNTGEFLGNPATNKKTNIKGMSVWTFNSEGKAIQEDAFFDNLTMFQQLGYKELPTL